MTFQQLFLSYQVCGSIFRGRYLFLCILESRQQGTCHKQLQSVLHTRQGDAVFRRETMWLQQCGKTKKCSISLALKAIQSEMRQ